MPKQALLVVDMLNDFLDPSGALFIGPAGREIIPFVAAKIAEFRAQGEAVIFLCDAHDPADPEFQRFPPHAVKGSWGAQIIPELSSAPTDYRVEKHFYTGWHKTNLPELLQQLQIREAYLVGVCTSICVLETARDLSLLGYEVAVYREGVADLTPEDHEWALRRLVRLYGVRVVPEMPPETNE